ncbi:hypothetical protein K474DRAFT_1677456 [Panus rudis PR-1116 ss-1]|nr:hypothetical protein K474DRAFT_1677456 [Panus rudis PR-1116 ss-1]
MKPVNCRAHTIQSHDKIGLYRRGDIKVFPDLPVTIQIDVRMMHPVNKCTYSARDGTLAGMRTPSRLFDVGRFTEEWRGQDADRASNVDPRNTVRAGYAVRSDMTQPRSVRNRAIHVLLYRGETQGATLPSKRLYVVVIPERGSNPSAFATIKSASERFTAIGSPISPMEQSCSKAIFSTSRLGIVH